MKNSFVIFGIFTLTILLSTRVLAQVQIEGSVFDAETREGLSNVSVIISGTTQGTFTNQTGKFTLTSKKNVDSLQFTMLGYDERTVKVEGENLIVALEQKSIEMDQLIITSTKEKSLRGNAPISFSKIASRRVKNLNSENAAQILNKTASIHIADFGNEQLSVSIRQPLAFGKAQMVILEDEIPIGPTSIVTASDAKEVNLANIRSVEVIRGPSSSIYGSEAVGGVINFISKRPSLLPSFGLAFQGSNFGYLKGDASFGATFGKVGVSLNGYYAQRRNGYREHSDYNKLALSGSLIYYLSENIKWENSFTYADYRTDFAGSLDSTLFHTNDQFNQHTFTFSSLNLFRYRSTLKFDWNPKHKSFITFFFRDNNEEEIPTYRIKATSYFPVAKYGGEYNRSSYNSYGALMQHKTSFDLWDAQLIGGLSFDYTPYSLESNKIDVVKEGDYYTDYSETEDTIQFFDSNLMNGAAYLHLEASPLKKLKLIGALRYDILYYQFDNHLPPTATSGAPDENNHFSQLSPKIGLIYNFKKNNALYSNFSVGFAPPYFNSLYKNVIVPTLKPAVFNNYEIGSWWSLFDNQLYLDVAAFDIEGRNELVEVFMPDGSTENQSIGKTRHIGVDYSLRYKHDSGVYGNYAGTNVLHEFVDFNDSEQDYSANEMSIAPRYFSSMAIGFEGKDQLNGFRIEGEWQRMGSYYLDNANTEKYDGYHFFNARIGYEWRGIDLWMNVLNLTDELFASRVSKSVYKTSHSTIVVKSYSPGFRRTIQFGIKYNLNLK